MYNRTLDYLKKQEQEGKVFIFRPNQPLEVDRCEKDPAKLAKLYNQGYEEAVNQLPQLLNWMKSVSN